MDLLSIILIAIGLAMDCFAVSTAQGLGSNTQKRQPKYLLMALLFGLFQGGMPLIGYYAGNVFSDFFSRYAPWIALVMLATIGGKMIWESLQKKEEKNEAANWSITHLLLLAVATSIDALATGVIFIPVPDKLWLGISIIGLVSFIFSIGGYHIGRWVGRLKINVELIGGLILVGIGIKICVEGVCF